MRTSPHRRRYFTSEDYLVATCPDLHRVAKVEPHRRWKCRRSGHWTGGAWHLPPGLVTGPVDDGELEQRRLLYHPRNLTGRGPADGQGGPPGLLEGL